MNNFYDSDLSYEGIQNIKNEREHFWDNIFSINTKQINIVVSPLKRAINTLLISIKKSKYSHIFKKAVITVTPLISEHGKSEENFGMNLEALKTYPSLLSLKKLVKDIKFSDFDGNKKWFPVPNDTNIFSNNKIGPNQMVILFSHWGVANKLFNIHLSNFGQRHYYYIKEINHK